MIGKIVLTAVLALVVVACGPTPEEEEIRRGIHCSSMVRDSNAPWDFDNIDTSYRHKTVIPSKANAVKGKIVVGSIEDGYHSANMFFSVDGVNWMLMRSFTYSNSTCDFAPQLPYKDSRDNA